MIYVKKYIDMLISVLMSQIEHDTTYCLLNSGMLVFFIK